MFYTIITSSFPSIIPLSPAHFPVYSASGSYSPSQTYSQVLAMM